MKKCKKTKNTLICFFLVGIILLNGCASARIKFTAKNAKFPVSMSEGFYDKNYNLVLSEDYKIINSFQLRYSKFSINWIFPEKCIDLSDKLADMIKKWDGDAIVNFRLETKRSIWNDLFAIIVVPIGIGTVGLIFPSIIEVTVRGEIVKLSKKESHLFNQHENQFLVIYQDGKTMMFSRKS